MNCIGFTFPMEHRGAGLARARSARTPRVPPPSKLNFARGPSPSPLRQNSGSSGRCRRAPGRPSSARCRQTRTCRCRRRRWRSRHRLRDRRPVALAGTFAVQAPKAFSPVIASNSSQRHARNLRASRPLQPGRKPPGPARHGFGCVRSETARSEAALSSAQAVGRSEPAAGEADGLSRRVPCPPARAYQRREVIDWRADGDGTWHPNSWQASETSARGTGWSLCLETPRAMIERRGWEHREPIDTHPREL